MIVADGLTPFELALLVAIVVLLTGYTGPA